MNNDNHLITEAYKTLKEASLSTGNVPGQTQYSPYNVSPTLKAAGQDYVNTMQSVGQGIKQAGRVLTNPAAADQAFGTWSKTNNLDSAKLAFKQKEYEQALEKILSLAGIPNTDVNKSKIHTAVSQLYLSIQPPNQANQVIQGPTPAVPQNVTPSKMAVRPK